MFPRWKQNSLCFLSFFIVNLKNSLVSCHPLSNAPFESFPAIWIFSLFLELPFESAISFLWFWVYFKIKSWSFLGNFFFWKKMNFLWHAFLWSLIMMWVVKKMDIFKLSENPFSPSSCFSTLSIANFRIPLEERGVQRGKLN